MQLKDVSAAEWPLGTLALTVRNDDTYGSPINEMGEVSNVEGHRVFRAIWASNTGADEAELTRSYDTYGSCRPVPAWGSDGVAHVIAPPGTPEHDQLLQMYMAACIGADVEALTEIFWRGR